MKGNNGPDLDGSSDKISWAASASSIGSLQDRPAKLAGERSWSQAAQCAQCNLELPGLLRCFGFSSAAGGRRPKRKPLLEWRHLRARPADCETVRAETVRAIDKPPAGRFIALIINVVPMLTLVSLTKIASSLSCIKSRPFWPQTDSLGLECSPVAVADQLTHWHLCAPAPAGRSHLQWPLVEASPSTWAR